MRLKLPDNFGGITIEGAPVKLTPDADGCVNAPDGVAQMLLAHGAIVAPDPVEENEKLESELEDLDEKRKAIADRKQKAK